uniref:Uncharacterized protein n=1 Tax=Onchocerca volvulus TaxID=6282 RepID=A0A8R1Y114_ONCVO
MEDCSQSTNHFELHYANPEAIQQASKRHGCGCCQFCMLLLKYTGILCNVFCCSLVPEMITRKLAFHPPSKGRTYIICAKNARGNLVRTNNVKKAPKFISLKLEAKHFTEGSPVPVEDIEITALPGYSIGTAPTVYITSKHPPNFCVIVLIASFASGLRLSGKAKRTSCMDRFLKSQCTSIDFSRIYGYVAPKSYSEILVGQFPRVVAPFSVEHASHLTVFSGHFPSVLIRIRHLLFHETDTLQYVLM